MSVSPDESVKDAGRRIAMTMIPGPQRGFGPPHSEGGEGQRMCELSLVEADAASRHIHVPTDQRVCRRLRISLVVANDLVGI
jgi:hypothetical protein